MHTPKRRNGPVRWAALGSLFAAGVTAVAQPPAGPPTQTPPAPPASPTIIQPTTDANPSRIDKTVEFQMRDRPWRAVLEWLSNETGLPVITTATPTGTFSFYGTAKKKHTIPEVIDVLNEALLNQKFVLIRREASFTIIPADVPPDPAILPRIRVEELPTRGGTEIVSVVYQLNSLVAEDAAPEVKKMLGPFGDVVALTRSNQLVMQDTAKSLRRAIETIEMMEKNEKGTEFSHTCQFIRARDAEKILKDLLGDPVANLRAVAQATQPQGGGGRQDQGGGRQPAPNVAMPKFRPFYITADERLNTVLVSGPADKIAQARDILKRIDVAQPGQKPFIVAPWEFRNYPVGAGTADQIVKTLQELYKNAPAVRIGAVGGNTVMVYASPDDHFEVARLIKGADLRSSVTELLPLNSLDADKVAITLKGMFQDLKTGSGPYIEADVSRNVIIVKGTTEQVADVKSAFQAVTGGDAAMTGNVRVISLDRGSAAALAAELERLMSPMRNNPVRVITPGGGEQPKEAPKAPEQPKRPAGPGGNGGGADDPPSSLVDPRAQKPGGGEPVNITVIGNRLVITSRDPQALQLANDLARLIIQAPTNEGDFEVIRLKNANASDAAKVIDEAFNGPRGGQQQQQTPGFQFPFGGGRGFQFPGMQQPQPAAAPATTKVRVVADPASNSLLVKASPLEMLSIKKLIRESIDVSDENRTLMKTYIIGPLKFAKAEEVAQMIQEVYRDSLSSNNPQAGGRGGRGGGGGFPFFMGGGQQSQRITDATGNPRPAALSVGINEQTNSVVLHCAEGLYKDISKLVEQIEDTAKGSPRSWKVVQVKGVDPTTVQQAIDVLQGRGAGTTNTNNPTNQFGGFGGFGNRGGGGGGGGNRGGGGGNRGGGRNTRNRAPDRESGPENFERVAMDGRPNVNKDDANFSQLFDPNAVATPPAYAGEEQQQPPAGQRPVTPADDIRGPLGDVGIQPLPDLGAIIINAENKEDLLEVEKLIQIIQQLAANAEVQFRLVYLKQADATNIVNTLNGVYTKVIVGPGGNIALPMDQRQAQQPTRQTNPFFGAVTTQTEGASSVVLVPLPRFNAILVGAAKSRTDDVLKDIERLDMPTTKQGQATPIALKKASASRVASQITDFYARRYPNENEQINQIRVFADEGTNTVFVQAAPADLAEIRELINRIDNSVSSAVNDLRIIQLRNALSDELANTILQAITQGLVAPTATAAPGVVPRPGGQQIPGQQQRPGAQAAPQPQVGPGGVTTKTTTLRFYGRPGPNGVVESGFLEDVHITSEPRSNSLIIAAPPKTMELIYALVRELDVVSSARAQMKIFTLRNSDARSTATLLQQLFLGAAGGATGAAGAQAGLTGPTAAGSPASGARPLLSITGQPSEGATLVDFKLTIDDRSNSIIVSGSPNDLQVIEAIVSRLEDADVQGRRNEVYKLRNAAAADVANALQQFLTNSLAVLQRSGQLSAYQDLMREVVIVPEPISNTLLVSATPRYYEDMVRIIAQIDSLPPQVVIQVLIADVRLTNNEEFGVEVGLQSPILFQRSIIPGTPSFSGGLVGNGGVPLPNGVNIGSAQMGGYPAPGFNFNSTQFVGAPLPNGVLSPETVGFQGLGNLGVGRVSPTSGVSGLVFSAASDTFSLLIRALKLQGRVDILSRPQIMTLDNQTAAVNVGQNVPILGNSTIAATGIAQQSIDRRDVGINLYVTPRITPDGRVLLRVAPEVSAVSPTLQPLGNGQSAAVINQQKVETTVTAMDGETIVIGGLITTSDNKQENKIPWLGDLPWVGAAFRYRTQSREKRELLVILTPHIVRSQADAERILMEEARKMDWVLGDVCKVHGQNNVAAILPTPPGCANSAMPALGAPCDIPSPAPGLLPTTPGAVMPPQPTPLPAPALPDPSQSRKPIGQTIQPASHTQPATDNKAKPNANGKDSKPWVFRRDW